MSEDDGKREDVLKLGEVQPDAMELYEVIMRMSPDIRDQIVVLSMFYIERLLDESSDDPPLQ